MTLGERINLIRKENGLTLEKFGERIDLKKSALSQYEHDTASPSDRTIRSICREFDIREDWLRTGAEPMREERTRDEILAEKLEGTLTAGNEEFRKRLIAVLVGLPPDKWRVLEEIAESVLAMKSLAPETHSNAEPLEPKNVHDWTREEMHAEVDRQYDAEEKGTGELSTGFPDESGADCA